MCNQGGDTVVAEQCIAADRHCGIVIDIQGVSNGCRGAGRAGLRNHSRVDEAVGIVIGQSRIVNEHAVVHIVNQNTISVPSEDVGFAFHAAVSGSADCDLCTLTDVLFANFNRGDGREFSRCNLYINRIRTSCCRLFDNEVIRSSIFNRIGGQSQFIATIHCGIQIIDKPLIREILNIVIVNMTGEVGDTTLTDSGVFHCDGGNRSSLDVHIIRLAHDRATSTEVNSNRVAIRLIRGLTGTKSGFIIIEHRCNRVLCHTRRVVIHVPSLLDAVKVEIVIPTYIGNKFDNVTFTEHLVAGNHNGRQRTHCNRISKLTS